MKEAEWLKSCDRRKMLIALRRYGSDRKRRLFACTLCRSIWHLIDEGPCRRAVEASERYADGEIGEPGLIAAQKATWSVVRKDETRTQANLAASRLARTSGVDDSISVAVLAEEVEIEEIGKQVVTRLRTLEASHCDLIREIVGNPFRPKVLEASWRTNTVVRLAKRAYQERAFDALPVLADALEEAGCDDSDLLAHFRHPGQHVRGCWALDLVLNRE